MKRLIALVVTVAIFALLFWKIDRVALAQSVQDTNMALFALALLLFVPQILVIAYRWRMMVSLFAPITMRESVSLVLASQAMNLVLPSKMGDLTKAVFLRRTGTLDLKRSTNIVIFEKMLDVAALSLFMLAGVAFLFARGAASVVERNAALAAAGIGLLAVAVVAALYFIPIKLLPGYNRLVAFFETKPKLHKLRDLFLSSHEVISLFQSRGGNRLSICALSLLIWILHLIQIYLFFACLGAWAPVAQFISLVPLAIFIGLLPISIAGFGTRDAAIIYFFPQYAAATMLAVALYINLRYIVPAIAGIPFLNRYITYTRELATAKP